MHDATLCFLFREKPKKQILLAEKKRGFATGKLNGYGGKVAENESIEEAAVRELFEESSIKISVNDLEKVGEIAFIFPPELKDKNWNQLVHVYFVKSFKGKPVETDEMKPEWFDIDNLPFEKMWSDDPHWLPLVLQNKKIKAKCIFKGKGEEIEKFELEELR